MAAGDGLVSMTPSSVTHSGTSASINADGGVDFSAITSVSLNDVFTSSHDNYLIVMNFTSSGTEWAAYRLRSAGTDATGNNYVSQNFFNSGGTLSSSRGSAIGNGYFGISYAAQRAGWQAHVYGPNIAAMTATRCVAVSDASSASMYEMAGTHSLTTAYDGITILTNTAGTLTGTIHVFGYEE